MLKSVFNRVRSDINNNQNNIKVFFVTINLVICLSKTSTDFKIKNAIFI